MARATVEYDGHTWTRRDDGYYGWGRWLLHRYVYTREVGPIPDGHHVHHRDHDQENNAAENLAAMDPTAHALHHLADKGPAWHAAGGRASAAARPVRTDTCVRCGTVFQHRHSTTAKFCSPYCKDRGAPSRAPEHRLCSVCGGGFTCPRRNPTRTCSPACRSVAAYQTRKGL